VEITEAIPRLALLLQLAEAVALAVICLMLEEMAVPAAAVGLAAREALEIRH
jgi:hypothetical protein